MLKKLALLSATVATAFAMHTAEININNKDLELGAQFDMGQFNESVEPNTVFVGAKWLKADKSHTSNSEKPIDPYFEANLLMMQNISQTPFRLGLGIKVNNTRKYTTIPLGVEASFLIPAKNLIPMRINGAVYYAPKVLSMRDADNFFETRIALDVEVIKNGNVTVGYRRLDTNYKTDKGSDFRYNRSAYIGFKLNF